MTVAPGEIASSSDRSRANAVAATFAHARYVLGDNPVTALSFGLFILLMIAAAITHVRRNEIPMIAINAVLGALAAFVAIGRF